MIINGFRVAGWGFLIGYALPVVAQDRPPETDQQRRMAQQMAEWMDALWEADPASGTANLRIRLVRDDAPLGMEPSIPGAFAFRAERPARGQVITQAFNPNANGRWVYERLEPGTYTLHTEGGDAFAGWSWTANGVTVEPGDAPLFEVTLDE